MVYNSVVVGFSDRFLQQKFIWFSYNRVFQIVVRDGGSKSPLTPESKILLRGFFYQVKGTWGGVISTVWTFFKAKTAFCEYSTPMKIKINMI